MDGGQFICLHDHRDENLATVEQLIYTTYEIKN